MLKNRNNALSLSMINIWGTLLIGGEVFRIFFSVVNLGEQDVYFYQKKDFNISFSSDWLSGLRFCDTG
jgi:hypothetical protein